MRVNKIKKAIYCLVEKVCSYNTSRIVCISDFEKESAIQKKIGKNNNVITINNGVDVKRINKIDEEKKKCILKKIGFPEDAFIIGQVARLDEQKNPLLFVEIAKIIAEKNNDVYFIMVGDGKLRDDVETKIREYDLQEKFYITGWTNKAIEYASCFSIGTLTSKWEGFGLVLVEYMLLEIPVVATRVDGIQNVIQDNVNGLLCKNNYKDDFVESISLLISNREIYSNLSVNGKKIAKENFSMERVVKEHIKLFNLVLNKDDE